MGHQKAKNYTQRSRAM